MFIPSPFLICFIEHELVNKIIFQKHEVLEVKYKRKKIKRQIKCAVFYS